MPQATGGVARRLALAVAVNLGLLGVAEGALALAGWPEPGLYDGDPGFYWTLRPDLDLSEVPHPEVDGRFAVRTNALGLRDGPLPTEGPWVLALGCSTTFGWGVEPADAWPERLEAALGVPVVNAGVPGHSTAQGRQFAPALLEAGPTVAVLGWIVRDAQRAGRPDAQAQPSPWLQRTHLFRGLKSMLPAPTPHQATEGGVPRVGPDDYRAHLEALLTEAAQHSVSPLLLAFPMQEPSPEHLAVLDDLGAPVVAPELPASAFFERDPIHLTPEGNRALARALEAPVREALGE